MNKPTTRLKRSSKKTSSAQEEPKSELITNYIKQSSLDHLGSSISLERDDEEYKKFPPENISVDGKNPRPNWHIDDNWLKRHALLGSDNCLVKINTKELNPETMDSPLISIPEFEDLANNPDRTDKMDYLYLKELAESIAEEGVIHPIEIVVRDDKLVVSVGHLRRLASLLGMRSFITGKIKGGLSAKSERDILKRRNKENNIRKKYSFLDYYRNAINYISTYSDEEAPPTNKELAEFLVVNIKNYAPLFDVCRAYPSGSKKVPYKAIECVEQERVNISGLRKLMAYKQFKRRESEAEKILKGNAKISKDPKKQVRVVSWRVDAKKAVKIGGLILDRIPELQKHGVSVVENPSDLNLIFKAIEELSEKGDG